MGPFLVTNENLRTAITTAHAATNLATAFLAGYRAALRQLVPTLAPDYKLCLCATEAGGAHPRAIQTQLTIAPDGTAHVTGEKAWVTSAGLADHLLVVASIGNADTGRNRLRVALVAANAPGITFTPQPPTPFVPEIPHAKVSFAQTPVVQLLEGDGYDRYLKPFRTIEDTFVFACTLAYLEGHAGRNAWSPSYRERIFALLTTLDRIASSDPSDAATHLALAGALAFGHALANEADDYFTDPIAKAEWQRDKSLLFIASKARHARTTSAWTTLSPRD